MSRVVAVVQARLGSERLPGKVLRELPADDPAAAGLTVLDWCVERLRGASTVAEVVVATSDEAADDELAEHCRSREYAVTRGSLRDVLDRVLAAAEAHRADTVVRVTADCPLIDPEVVDRVVAQHLARHDDFTANRLPPPHPRTWPIGLDVEVASIGALRRAGAEATEPAHREHVMPYLYAEPGRFAMSVLECDLGDHGTVRWTVDTPGDLAAVGALVARPGVRLGSSWTELLAEWRSDPTLAALNADVAQKSATDVDGRD